MGILVFACLLTIGGTDLPFWAWVFAVGMAVTDVLTSEILHAFLRGLFGKFDAN